MLFEAYFINEEHKMLEGLKKALASDNELDNETLRLLSLLFLLASGVMPFFNYTHTGVFAGVFAGIFHDSFSFQPKLISTIFAICLISPLYLRGILKWSKSIYSLLSFVLILLVFASFTELAIGGGSGTSSIVIPLLVAAVVLSWLGVKAVASASWGLALAAAIYSAIVSDLAMGFAGFIYIGSGFIGLVLHSGLNPGDLFEGIRSEYSGSAASVISDISDTVKK
jgi:phage shock protein PspC (stress-responsive transcriptional regulator)